MAEPMRTHDGGVLERPVVLEPSWWRPPRGYRWPPFTSESERGNTKAVQHGAKCERRWRPIADRLVLEATGVAPWLGRPVYAAAVNAWARAEAACQLIASWIEEHGALDDEGVPRAALNALATWEARAESARSKLGLSPADLAKLLSSFLAAAGQVESDEAIEHLRREGAAFVARQGVTDS